MTEPHGHENEILDLLSYAWDRGLDAATAHRLEALLSAGGPAAIETLTEFSRLHTELQGLVSSENALRKTLELLAKTAAERGRPRGGRHWIGRRVGRRPFVSALIAASLLVAAAMSWRTFFEPNDSSPTIADQPVTLVRAPLPIARIVESENSEWADGVPRSAGQPLFEGQTIELRKGTAQISMGFGADLILCGPCTLLLVSDELVRLKQGNVIVQAAEWAKGFVVETNDLSVTDLGTRFAVSSPIDGPSEAHVLEGTVVAKSLKAAPRQPLFTLNAGDAVHVNLNGMIHRVDAVRERFAGRFDNFQPLRPIEIRNTGVGLNTGDRDSHWTITAGDETTGPYPQPAVVGPPFPIYRDNDPDRSQWISIAGGTKEGAPAWSVYNFETTFDLTGFDEKSVQLSGLVLADNGVREVRLNGRPLPIESWNDWYVGVTYYKFHSILIDRGFLPGVNRLTFVVNNDTYISSNSEGVQRPSIPNPMGLRVEWAGYGRPVGR